MRSTIVLFILTFAIFGLLLGLAESFDIRGDGLDLAAASVETTIAGYVDAMQVSSELPQVKSTGHLESISTAQMGIPEDLDVEKRQAARQLLAEHPAFESVFFLTPAGDVYLGEPFEQQEQLPRLNYADRDWYVGVNSTRAPYVSSVFMSAAINAPAVAVAVPVMTQDQVTGYWVAIVDLGDIKSRLAEFSGVSRILLIDHNATEIADTARTEQLTELRSFASLESANRALAGEKGAAVEVIDGVTVNTRFAPVAASPNTWGIIFFGFQD